MKKESNTPRTCYPEPVEGPRLDRSVMVRHSKGDMVREPHHDSLRNPLRLAAGIATLVASVLAGQGKAEAQQAVDFGPDVNILDPGGWPDAGDAQLIAGVTQNLFKLTFSGPQPDGTSYDIYAKECEILDNQNGGVTIRGLTLSNIVSGYSNPTASEKTLIEHTRPDGKVSRISMPGGGLSGQDIDVDGQGRWHSGEGCDTVNSISPSRNLDELKIVTNMGIPQWPHYNDDVWRVPIDAQDYCQYIEDAIATAVAAGKDPYQAGLLNSQESTWKEELSAPETDELLAVTRDEQNVYRTYLLARDPTTGALTNLRRNTDGTWVSETCTNCYDMTSKVAWAMLKRQTPNGRTINLLVHGENPPTGGAILSALALEKTGPNAFREVVITMDDVPAGTPPPDDDSDGVPNDVDNCKWRANPAQTDLTGPNGTPDGIGDACQADCGENFPGVSAPGEVNASGLRICPSELGYANGFSDEDGSTMHSNADVNLDATGDISLNPDQKLRYIHSKDPRVAEEPARRVKIPAGNSFRIKVHSNSQLDGTPGSITVTHHSYPDGAMTVDNLVPSSEWFYYEPGLGDVIDAEGCDYEVEAGDENLPITCETVPSVCPPVPDAGTDAGQPGTDAGTGTPDSGTEEPDGGTPPGDAGNPPVEDAGNPPVEDAGGTPVVDAGTPPVIDAGEPADAATPTEDAGADAGHDTDASGHPDAADASAGEDGGNHNGDTDGSAGSPDVPTQHHDGNGETTPDANGDQDTVAPDGATIRHHRADEGDEGGGCDCSVSPKNDPRFNFESLGLMVSAAVLAVRRRMRGKRMVG